MFLTGTGGSCVYPLLSARMNKWRFLATELDDTNFTCAVKNVERNQMTNLIQGKNSFNFTIYGFIVNPLWGQCLLLPSLDVFRLLFSVNFYQDMYIDRIWHLLIVTDFIVGFPSQRVNYPHNFDHINKMSVKTKF